MNLKIQIKHFQEIIQELHQKVNYLTKHHQGEIMLFDNFNQQVIFTHNLVSLINNEFQMKGQIIQKRALFQILQSFNKLNSSCLNQLIILIQFFLSHLNNKDEMFLRQFRVEFLRSMSIIMNDFQQYLENSQFKLEIKESIQITLNLNNVQNNTPLQKLFIEYFSINQNIQQQEEQVFYMKNVQSQILSGHLANYQKIITNYKNIHFIKKNSIFLKFKCNLQINNYNYSPEDVDNIIDLMKQSDISIIFCYHHPQNVILFKSIQYQNITIVILEKNEMKSFIKKFQLSLINFYDGFSSEQICVLDISLFDTNKILIQVDNHDSKSLIINAQNDSKKEIIISWFQNLKLLQKYQYQIIDYNNDYFINFSNEIPLFIRTALIESFQSMNKYQQKKTTLGSQITLYSYFLMIIKLVINSEEININEYQKNAKYQI